MTQTTTHVIYDSYHHKIIFKKIIISRWEEKIKTLRNYTAISQWGLCETDLFFR